MTTATQHSRRKLQPIEITIPMAHRIIDRMAALGLTWSDIDRSCRMLPGNAKKAWLGDKTLTRRQMDILTEVLGLKDQ